MSKSSFRYPGFKPFSQGEREQFFGRELDVESIVELLKYNAHLVLFGRSGLGKSSLIEAGLVPELLKNDHIPISIRLGFHKTETPWPLAKLSASIPESDPSQALMEELSSLDNSPWMKLKKLQIQYWETENRLPVFFLIFDQFEELFSYPRGIHELGISLSNLVNDSRPEIISMKIRHLLGQKDYQIPNEELELLEADLDVKVLFSIREDQLSLLHKLESQFPKILQHRYELSPLSREQAQRAIEEPAKLEKNKNGQEFRSNSFEFETGALDQVLGYLDDENKDLIEPFHLQLICEEIESKIIGRKLSTISPHDLDFNDFKRELENRYNRFIQNIGTLKQQKAVRNLFENGLIFLPERRRLSLLEGLIVKDYSISPDLLKKLRQSNYLRAEPRRGGVLYELGHDSLIDPILNSRQTRIKKRNLRNVASIGVLIFLIVMTSLINVWRQKTISEEQYVYDRLLRIVENPTIELTTKQYPDTIELFLDNGPSVRKIQLLKALRKRNNLDPIIINKVVPQLESSNDSIRINAMKILKDSYSLTSGQLDLILNLTAQKYSINVRLAAFDALKNKSLSDEQVKSLKEILLDGKNEVNYAILEILGNQDLSPGEPTYERIYSLLENSNDTVRGGAVLALSKQDSIPPVLMNKILDFSEQRNDTSTLALSIRALGNIDHLNRKYVDKIGKYLSSEYPLQIRRSALEALANQNHYIPQKSLPQIIEIARNPTTNVVLRTLALKILANDRYNQINRSNDESYKVFIHLQLFSDVANNSKNPIEVRRSGITYLGSQKFLDQKYIAMTINIADDPSESDNMRISALESLNNQRVLYPENLERIEKLTLSNMQGIQIAAINLLGRQTRLSTIFLDSIRSRLQQSKSDITTITCLNALSEQEDLNSKYLDEMRKQFSSESYAVRLAAINSFRKQDLLPPKYLSEISQKLDSDDQAMKNAVIEILSNQSGLPHKYQKILVETDETVK